MAALEHVPRLLRHVLQTSGCYMITRSDGRLLVGATVEHRGFTARPTAAGVHVLLASALLAVPGLADAPVVELWAGLRPGTPDDLPILGPDPIVGGLIHATGHFRNGILLAPITGELIADAITGARSALSMDAFAAARFATGAGA